MHSVLCLYMYLITFFLNLKFLLNIGMQVASGVVLHRVEIIHLYGTNNRCAFHIATQSHTHTENKK